MLWMEARMEPVLCTGGDAIDVDDDAVEYNEDDEDEAIDADEDETWSCPDFHWSIIVRFCPASSFVNSCRKTASTLVSSYLFK
jgi:hypothetical protein